MRYWLILLALFLGLFHRAYGANYYCATTGTDAGTGAIGSPFGIAKACTASVLVAGDTVFLRGGTYMAYNHFPYACGAGHYSAMMAPARYGVTYHSYHGEWAVLRGDDDWSGFTDSSILINTIVTSYADSITFDSIEIRYGAKYGIMLCGVPEKWTIRNCVIDSCPDDGGSGGDNEGAISAPDDTHGMVGWTIEDNVFNHIRVRGAIHSYKMANTTIQRNTFYGIGVSYGAIFLKTGAIANRNNEWAYNTIHCLGGPGMGVHCNGDVQDLRIHHNLVYGTPGQGGQGGMIQLSYSSCFQDPATYDSIFLYNNTFDFQSSNSAYRGIIMAHGDDATDEFADNVFVFNNIIYRPGNTNAVHLRNVVNDNQWGEFGENWYSNYNAFILRGSGDDIYTYRNSSGVDESWTLTEWKARAELYNPSWMGDSNSYASSDTTNLFINRGAADYNLDPAYANYSTLATGGRGGAWPTYIGAFDPNVSDSCPSVGRDSIPNSATTTDITPNYVFDIGDTNNDSVFYKLLRDTFNPPTTVRFSGTVATPANNITHTESGLADRTTYFWRIAYTDTVDVSGGDSMASCVETTSVYNYFVDTVKCPTVTQVYPSNGATVTALSIIPKVNVQTDGYTNIILRFYGDVGDPTPNTLRYTDTLTADSTGWSGGSPNGFTWSGLTEDQTHYWQVVVVDPDCSNTSPVWSFLVDAVGTGSQIELDGTVLEGVRIGKYEDDAGTPAQRHGPCGVDTRPGTDCRARTGPAGLAVCAIAR